MDIIIVTYNSSRWVTACLNSILAADYMNSDISVTFVDNGSQDQTVDIIENYPDKEQFGGYQCVQLQKNCGFGSANNYGVKCTVNPYILLLNADTELYKDALLELKRAVIQSESVTAMWEMRQVPYEHPKWYNPVSLETTWCSAAACLVRREVFEECEGFDESIFMYAEDVDLSWRFRQRGYKLQYVPTSVVKHYSYSSPGIVKPLQQYSSIVNNLRLRFKFGRLKDIAEGYVWYLAAIIFIRPKGYVMSLIAQLLKSFGWSRKYRMRRTGSNFSAPFEPVFNRFEYELAREGAFYTSKPIAGEAPLISILVRTTERPEVLREALLSIRNQTYPSLEVVVVEDGMNASEWMINKDFADLNITYRCTSGKSGRTRAANLALQHARGAYFCFLDDDDLLFAEHIEVLYNEIIASGKRAAYSLAYEAYTEVESTSPEYCYEIKDRRIVYRENFNRRVLLYRNFFPIQTVLFSRSLYDELGGMDESFEYLEDWDLWLRYAASHEFVYVDKATSVYKVPYQNREYSSRKILLQAAHQKILDKHRDILKEIPSVELEEGEKRIKAISTVRYKLKNKSFKQIVGLMLDRAKQSFRTK
nr:glycosyltransferase family 2 protein [Paenibacillus oenotherae]